MHIIDISKISLLFCYHNFGVRHSIYVLGPEKQPASGTGKNRTRFGAQDLQRTPCIISMKTKKVALKIEF